MAVRIITNLEELMPVGQGLLQSGSKYSGFTVMQCSISKPCNCIKYHNFGPYVQLTQFNFDSRLECCSVCFLESTFIFHYIHY